VLFWPHKAKKVKVSDTRMLSIVGKAGPIKELEMAIIITFTA
jgi:hypothetical protein